MKRLLALICAALILDTLPSKAAISAPTGLVSRSGDRSVVLHWDPNLEPDIRGYRVYRSANTTGPFTLQTTAVLTAPSFCDLAVTNGQTNSYRIAAVTLAGEESPPTAALPAAARPFSSNDDFLAYVQQTSFDYFWYGANPANGLVPDRLPTASPCSIAAVGFGLTAIGIGVDHGWITRTQAVARVLITLNTFLQHPQGPASSGTIGYKGWFYHFLDMKTGLRHTAWNTELSSIDTVLLLAGILYAKQYFDRANPEETSVRTMADAIINRVDWQWMARGTDKVCMGWHPPGEFIPANWVGYNEAMILYCLGLGAATKPLPDTAWATWTRGYTWTNLFGQAFVPFPPLFGHQYSHCWIDFRHTTDSYMRAGRTSYFENSRRATLAQRAYCIANPGNAGYSSNVWGLTACDGPNATRNGVTYQGYAARGAPPAQADDGTVAPTAAGGSIAFTPEYSIPTLRYFYDQFRTNIWTAYGFRDAFNLRAQWWGPDVLGIDQGPIIIMIENYRTGNVWKLFMRNEEVQRGLRRAGFR